jgi:acyl CoA:acetate/3-ketoacid CoA transferase beta subunit
MSDPPNIARALYCGGLNDVMYLLQSGRVDLGFIGGAEIDRYGNLNTHWVEESGKRTRLPGSGGAADIATMARRSIIIMNHERRRLVPKVHYIVLGFVTAAITPARFGGVRAMHYQHGVFSLRDPRDEPDHQSSRCERGRYKE